MIRFDVRHTSPQDLIEKAEKVVRDYYGVPEDHDVKAYVNVEYQTTYALTEFNWGHDDLVGWETQVFAQQTKDIPERDMQAAKVVPLFG